MSEIQIPAMRFTAALLFYTAVSGWVESFQTKDPGLWSLRCVYAGEEACNSALEDYILPDGSANETFPELEVMFSGLERDVQDVFVRHKANTVSPHYACQVPKPLLLLLPAEYLSEMRGDVLGKLLGCNVDDLAIVRLIADAAQDLIEPYPFYFETQSLNLDESVLSILGEEIKSLKSITSAQWLVSQHKSTIDYLDPEIIIEDNYNLFQLMRNMDPIAWGKRPQRVKRIWAFVLPKFIHPLLLSDWDDSHLESLGHLLVGSTVQELNGLSANRIQNKTRLFSHPFSLVQARGLFDSIYHQSIMGKAVYLQIRGILHKLLPGHLQHFNEGSLDYLDHVKYSEPTCLATSRQIVEYIIRNGTVGNSSITKESFTSLNQLLYSLPLSTFRELPFSLTFKELLPLQHHKLSAAQLYYLTGGGNAFRLTIDGIHGAHDLLRGIPTQLLSRAPPSAVYAYLMAELPGSVPPRMAALLDNFIFSKTGSVSDKNFRSIFRNKDARKYLNLLPSKYVERHYETILQALQHYTSTNPSFFNEIPDHVLSVLLTKALDRNFSWEKFAVNNGTLYPLLLRGLTCSDVNSLSPADFIHVISRFNSLRSTYGWKFPKNLQKCSLVKFVEYLYMKSAFMTYYLGASLVSLMSPSDVEAVGGFVLADLPIMEIRTSPVRDLIVKAVGSLSLPELLIAARTDKLADIGELYYRPKIGKNLFNLGNLTAFLNVASIRTVDPLDFKLMLESGYLDKRVCAMDTQRDAWSNLILDAFGSADRWTAQELVTLGDMLVVVPHHDLSRVKPQVWAEAADVISKTGYFEMIAVSDAHLPFYEVCEKLFSDTYEATTYRRELSEYVGWLLMSAQYQMDTVLTAKSMSEGEKVSPFYRPKSTDPFDMDQPDESNEDSEHFWSKIFPFSTLRSKNGKQGGYATKLSCDAIRMVGKPAGLFLSAATIDEMDKEEIENCKEEFGKMDLTREMGLLIWTKLNKQWAPHLAEKLLSQAASTDIIGWNMSFTNDKWSHETIYYLANYNHDDDTKSALQNKIDDQKLSLLSVEQVVALGPLTCRLSGPRVTPNVFFKASRHLGANLPCSLTCLMFFASSFQNVDAYGPIASWTPEDVESLGILIAGLDLEDWTTLVENPKLLSRIGSRAVECLPKSHLQVLTEPSIQNLPATTATFLLNELAFNLNSMVKAALELQVAPKVDLQSPETHQIVYVWQDNRYQPSVDTSNANINNNVPNKMLQQGLLLFYPSYAIYTHKKTDAYLRTACSIVYSYVLYLIFDLSLTHLIYCVACVTFVLIE